MGMPETLHNSLSQSVPRDSGHPAGGWSDRRIMLALFAFGCLVYISATGHGFVVDDHLLLVENPYVKSFHYLRQIFRADFWSFRGLGGNSNFYRPLVMLTLLLEYAAFGFRPAWYHLVNILLNAGVVVLFYRVAREWWPKGSGPLWGALLFAVLPLHVENVSPVSGLSDVGCGFFLLFGLWFYVRGSPSGAGPRPRDIWLAAAFLFLAALFKEVAVLVLPMLIYYEHLVRRDGAPGLVNRFLRYLPALLCVAVYMVLRISALHGLTTFTQRPDATWTGTVLSAFSLLGLYLYKFVWPQYLTYFLTFHPPQGLTDLYVMLGIAWSGVAVLGLLRTWKRAPAVAFCILWFFVMLWPTLNIHWLGVSVYGERYLYIPSMGLCWLAGAGLGWLTGSEEGRPPIKWKLATAVASAIILAYGIRTEIRLPDWKNNLTLAQATLRVDPESGSRHVYVGNTYRNLGDREGARREYIQAIALEPGGIEAYLDLAGVFMDDGAVPTARLLLQRAAELDPTFPETFYTWGVVELGQGNKDRARKLFERAVALNPNFGDALNNLGALDMAEGRLEAAQQLLTRAVVANPSSLDSHINRGAVLARRGLYQEATIEFRRAMQLAPGSEAPYLGLASAYEEEGNSSAAWQVYQEAVRALPASGNAWFRMGVLAMKMGNTAQATAALARAAAIQPNSPLAHLQLGLALVAAGKEEDARRELGICLRLDPQNQSAQEALRKLP